MLRHSAFVLAALILTQADCAQQPAHPSSTVSAAIQTQFHEALNAAQHGQQGQALTLTRALLQDHPDYVPALKLEGMLLDRRGDVEGAAAAYQKALKQSPNDPELLYNVGVYQLVSGHSHEAGPLLEHYLRLKPRDSDALYYLAQADHSNGDDQKALKAIRECVRIDPNKPEFSQKYGELLSTSGDDDGALEWLKKAQQADPTLERIDYDLAVANLNSLHFADAQVFAQKAVRDEPNELIYHSLLASIQLKLSMWSDAQAEFQQVLAADKDNPSALLGLGQCQLELKDFQASIATLQRLLALDPTQITAHFYLSRAYSAIGNTEEAAHESELHKRLTDQASFTRSGQGTARPALRAASEQARQLLSDGQEDKAIKLLQQGVQGASASPGTPYTAAGLLYLGMGKSEQATRMLNRALKIDPHVRDAHTYLGIGALLQGDLSRAETEFNLELSIDPNSATAIAELGEVRYRQQRWADAIELLTRSKTAIPPLLYMLCDSYLRLGKTDEAKLTAETLATYDRDDQQMMAALIDLLNRNQQTALAERIASNMKR
jgi:tetratricopeptide (TPR) repeat protein